jgi:cytochrome b6-f complex iron-sulfur subunit
MSEDLERRRFLSRLWKAGLVVMAGAAAWTSWDFLQPVAGSAGGPVATMAASDVPTETVVEIASMRGYLTESEGEVVPLWWKCPHLGCKVPWCESSGQFECPCHGSVFSRIGEYRRGPAPRGMDKFEYEVIDGVVVADTSKVIRGAPAGTPETIDEPPRGPECMDLTSE